MRKRTRKWLYDMLGFIVGSLVIICLSITVLSFSKMKIGIAIVTEHEEYE